MAHNHNGEALSSFPKSKKGYDMPSVSNHQKYMFSRVSLNRNMYKTSLCFDWFVECIEECDQRLTGTYISLRNKWFRIY